MKTVFLATVCVAASASCALASDLTIKSQLGQSLEISDNRTLSLKPAGVTYAPVTTAILDLLARTRTWQFTASTTFNYRQFLGPGAQGKPDALDKAARAQITKSDRRTTYYVGASWSERDASTVQLEDVGFATVPGQIVTYAADGGLTHQLGPRDKFNFTSRGSNVSFTSPTQTPYNDFSAVGTFTHRASPITDLISTVNYYFQDRSTSNLTLVTATGGFSSHLSPRLTLDATGGAVFIDAMSKTGAAPISNGIIPTSGSAADWVATALLSYRLTQTTTATLSAAKSTAPSALGEIQSRKLVNAILREQINHASSIVFSAGFTRQALAGGNSDVLNASVGYFYTLTRRSHAQVVYRYAQRTTIAGTAHANSITFAINSDLTLLP